MISVIVPSRGNPLGLWATIHSCGIALTGLEHEFVLVTNGEELCATTKQILFYLEKTGTLVHKHDDAPMSPPAARAVGVAASKGDVFCFLDAHCLVAPDYFQRVNLWVTDREVDILHSTTVFHSGQGKHYHYKLKLDYNFWAEPSLFAQYEHKPYRIAAAGHGGFAVSRYAWDRMGGYGPESLLKGYGGEELIFDLKAWRMGIPVWLDPLLIHYHFAGDRGYSRHYTDEYYTNLLVSALVVGGESWMYRLVDSLINKQHIRSAPASDVPVLIELALQRGAEYAQHLDSVCKMSLDEVLTMFKEQDIPR